MRRTFKALVTITATAAGLVGATQLYAHADDARAQSPRGMEGHGSMHGSGEMQGGMMQGQDGSGDKMPRMHQMMENCNNMMKGMGKHEGPDQAPSPQSSPEKKD